MFLTVLSAVSLVIVLAWLAHFISYRLIKERTLKERRWDYNICCGTTNGGGINADIVKHADLPKFELVTDVTRLPHPDGAFETVLCSHTIEHVADPKAMFAELRRIGRRVTILVPPVWDFTAAFNPFEHQVVFLSFKSRHENELPPFFNFAPARWLQRKWGQQVNADQFATDAGGSLNTTAHFATPLLFLAAALAAHAGHSFSLALFCLGWITFWLSHRRAGRSQSCGRGARPSVQRKKS